MLSVISVINAPQPEGVSVFSRLESVQALAAKCRRTVRGAGPNPFATWDWYLVWLKHFPEEYDAICFLTIRLPESKYIKSEVITVFPMVRKGNQLDLAGSRLGDYQDVLTNSPEDVVRCIEPLLAWSAANKLDIHFSKLSDNSILKSKLIDHANRRHAPLYLKQVGPCPTFSIEGNGLEDFLGRLGKSTRKGIRRRIRRFEEVHGKNFKVIEKVDRSFLEAAAELHRELQKGKSGTSIFDHPKTLPFLLEAAKMKEIGLLSSALYSQCGEKLIAFEIGYRVEDTYFAWVSSYDPAYGNYRVGTVAMTWLIDHLSQSGVKVFDFLCGAENYKYQYAKDEYLIHSVMVLPDTRINRGRIKMKKLGGNLRSFFKKIALRTGILRTNYRQD